MNVRNFMYRAGLSEAQVESIAAMAKESGVKPIMMEAGWGTGRRLKAAAPAVPVAEPEKPAAPAVPDAPAETGSDLTDFAIPGMHRLTKKVEAPAAPVAPKHDTKCSECDREIPADVSIDGIPAFDETDCTKPIATGDWKYSDWFKWSNGDYVCKDCLIKLNYMKPNGKRVLVCDDCGMDVTSKPHIFCNDDDGHTVALCRGCASENPRVAETDRISGAGALTSSTAAEGEYDMDTYAMVSGALDTDAQVALSREHDSELADEKEVKEGPGMSDEERAAATADELRAIDGIDDDGSSQTSSVSKPAASSIKPRSKYTDAEFAALPKAAQEQSIELERWLRYNEYEKEHGSGDDADIAAATTNVEDVTAQFAGFLAEMNRANLVGHADSDENINPDELVKRYAMNAIESPDTMIRAINSMCNRLDLTATNDEVMDQLTAMASLSPRRGEIDSDVANTVMMWMRELMFGPFIKATADEFVEKFTTDLNEEQLKTVAQMIAAQSIKSHKTNLLKKTVDDDDSALSISSLFNALTKPGLDGSLKTLLTSLVTSCGADDSNVVGSNSSYAPSSSYVELCSKISADIGVNGTVIPEKMWSPLDNFVMEYESGTPKKGGISEETLNALDAVLGEHGERQESRLDKLVTAAKNRIKAKGTSGSAALNRNLIKKLRQMNSNRAESGAEHELGNDYILRAGDDLYDTQNDE